MIYQVKKVSLFLTLAILVATISGCPMYTAVGFKYAEASEGGEHGQVEGEEPVMVEVNDPAVTLAWNPPPSDVEKYLVFFRIHTTDTWYELTDPGNTVPASPSPEYTVEHSQVVTNGVFDFGVKAVNDEEDESRRHTSLDITAQPDSGWYLIWNYTE